MKPRMVFTEHNTKVGGNVIKFVPIQMVNNLGRFKFSSEDCFHNGPMLKNKPSSDVDLAVSVIADCSRAASGLFRKASITVTGNSQVMGIAESIGPNAPIAAFYGAKVRNFMLSKTSIVSSKNSVHGLSSLPSSLSQMKTDGKRNGVTNWVNSGKPRPGNAEGNPERSREYTRGTCNDYWRGSAPLMTSTSAQPEREEIV